MNKISVIVPSYNSERTIARCIESILNQTYDNFELVVVSDGSTDNSDKIINAYAEKDSRIKHIRKERGGVSSARNIGLNNITGDYIEFVDSDDYLEPNMMERMLGAAIENNAELVICHFIHPSIHNYLGDMVLDMTKQADRFKLYQSTFAIVVPWNKLWKREAVTDKFDEEVAFNEDDLFGMSNMANVKTAVSISDVLYHYCVTKATDDSEASCITTMASMDDFWKKKESFWYMRNKLLPKVDKILEKHYARDDWDELKYSRTFDFMMWELIILHASGISNYGLVRQAQQVFKEPNFIKSVAIREKYGVRMKDMAEEELNENIIRYVSYFLDAYDYIRSTGSECVPFKVCLLMFEYIFMEENGRELNTIDIVADGYAQMRQSSSKEAAFVNEFMEKKQCTRAVDIEKEICK